MKYNSIKIIIIVVLSVFLISACRKKNRPPLRPNSPTGPSIGSIFIKYNFSSLAIDPDGDSITMRFDWGDGDTSSWTSDWDSWFASEQTVSISHSWLMPNTYYIRTQAKDKKDAISEWSLPHNIIISNHSPIPKTPSGRLVGTNNTPYQFSSSAVDPDNHSVSIRFDWGDEDTSDWSTWVLSGHPIWMEHSWSAIDTYYIRAQAKDTSDSISLWSSAHQIIIVSDSVKLYPQQVVATIPVGDTPTGVAALPNDSFIYVANNFRGDVSVIRTSDNVVVNTIEVGFRPNFLTALPNGDYVYVSNTGSGNVSVIRTSDNSVVDVIQTGPGPYELEALPNGDYIYVVNTGADNVSVIRTSDNKVVHTIPVGHSPNGIVALPDGNYVYVTNIGSDSVTVIRTSDNTVIATIPVGEEPHHIAALPSGDFVYVGNRASYTVSVIRTSDNVVVATIFIPNLGVPDGIEVLPNGNYVYVISEYEGCVYIIRTADNLIIDSVYVGLDPEEIEVLSNGNVLYVTNSGHNTVAVIDP